LGFGFFRCRILGHISPAFRENEKPAAADGCIAGLKKPWNSFRRSGPG